MDGTPDSAATGSNGVLVYRNDSDATPQPNTFQFCPLGVQFYTEKPMEECQMLEFCMKVPGDNGDISEIKCVGLVADSCHDADANLYRNWVKFLDLPLETFALLQRLSREHDFLCPYCENFR